MKRDELIAETKIARREWDRALKGISDLDFRKAQIYKAWTPKDIAGHLATYLQLNIRHVQSYLRRRAIASMRAKNWYQFNKREAVRLKHASTKKVLRDLDSAYTDLISLLPKLSDEDLKVSFPSPWSPASGRKVRLGTILRADVSRHLKEHAGDLRKWKVRENR